jgi:WD40 repeat protein
MAGFGPVRYVANTTRPLAPRRSRVFPGVSAGGVMQYPALMSSRACSRCSLGSVVLLFVVGGCDSATPPQDQPFGRVQVSALTTGPDADGDGYQVVLDNGPAVAISPNGSITLTSVRVGGRTIRLEGVASNCTVGGGISRAVSVNTGQVASVGFAVTCFSRGGEVPAAVGTLHITTATTGPDRDPDGYSVLIGNLNGSTTLSLPVGGTVTVKVAARAVYWLVLSGIAPNCRVSAVGSPDVVVDVAVGTTLAVSFNVSCEPQYPQRLAAGSQLAFVRGGQIHLVQSDGTGVVRLTDGPSDCDPAWSPDGARLAFVQECGGQTSAIVVMNADGTGLMRRTTGVHLSGVTWSPNGMLIAFASVTRGSVNIYTMNAVDDGKAAVEVVGRPGWDGHPAWSPDGSRIAYASDWNAYDFVWDIFSAAPDGSGITQLTTGFGFWPHLMQYYRPAWSPDSKSLSFVECPEAFYTCDVSTLAVMNADGTAIRRIAQTRGMVTSTWTPDGQTIAYSSGETIAWIRADASARGFIVEGHSPAWRPLAGARPIR